MKKLALLLILLLFLAGCSRNAPPVESTEVPATTSVTLPVTIPTTVPTVATEPETEPETTMPPPEPVVILTEAEQTMLLKIGMAERGECGCTECVALVMCTVLNRVNTEGRFGNSIRSVLFAHDQFTPVMDGTYDSAVPNERCLEALEMVIYGWDESQGALFYEWCEGESWHSKNLHLLMQHCDTRFYD